MNFDVAAAIDQDHNTGWATHLPGQAHRAVFQVAEPIVATAGAMLRVTLEFKSRFRQYQLGHFRLSASGDPALFGQEQKRFAAMQLTDPCARLAAAYFLDGDQPAVERLIKDRPAGAAGTGDIYAAIQDWQRAIDAYRQGLAEQPTNVTLLNKIATTYQSAGRTREAVPYLATQSAANPRDTALAFKVAALEAWFGMDKALAASRERVLATAKGTNQAHLADCAAKVCSLAPSPDKAQREAALDFGRIGVKFGNGNIWNLMSLGMAEYRNADYVAADKTLRAAVGVGRNPGYGAWVPGISGFYRAMSLFRQGKKDEARKLATETAAKMKPLPKDENNPLVGNVMHDDLILWLAYKEAKALIGFDSPVPPSNQKNVKITAAGRAGTKK